MKHHRLAIVRQKYRPDGGAERFVSRALTALSNQNLELNVITREWQGEKQDDWHIHICDPRKWGRISRERGFAHAARALWEQQQFDIVQSHERIPGCDIYRAGDGVVAHLSQGEKGDLMPHFYQSAGEGENRFFGSSTGQTINNH